MVIMLTLRGAGLRRPPAQRQADLAALRDGGPAEALRDKVRGGLCEQVLATAGQPTRHAAHPIQLRQAEQLDHLREVFVHRANEIEPL